MATSQGRLGDSGRVAWGELRAGAIRDRRASRTWGNPGFIGWTVEADTTRSGA
jgi:hypothetical protein